MPELSDLENIVGFDSESIAVSEAVSDSENTATVDSENAVICNTSSAAETISFGKKFAEILSDGDVVALDGDLGAGKTQFAQGVGAGLGVSAPMTSPTFNIVFEYNGSSIPLYHFDLYRLEDVSELEDIDFYALTDDSRPGVALIEWASKFIDELPEDAIYIYIEKVDNDSRKIHISTSDDQKLARIKKLCV